jgi:Domain of unknown function (DUF1905)/Bacteriocin-protection, YdeI or OmpD-Associated
MKDRKAVIRFTARLEKMTGRFGWTYVQVPGDTKKRIGATGRVRVLGTINGIAIDRALLPTRSGNSIIIVGGDLRKKAGVKEGDSADLEIWLNTRPDQLELPAELSGTLDFFPDFRTAFEGLTLGAKRSIVLWIGQGKTVATRAKRVAELLKRFEEGHPWFLGRPRKD